MSSSDILSTYKPATPESTPQLTPVSDVQDQSDVSELPPDLSEIILIWHRLPLHIRQAMSTLARVGADTPAR